MDLTRSNGRSSERPLRHARRHRLINVPVLVVTAVLTLSTSAVASGAIPGFRPAERLGIDVADAVGDPLGVRGDEQVTRSADRGGPVVADAAAGQQPLRAAAVREPLPTWTGEAAAVVRPAEGPSVTPTATPVDPTAVPGTGTATATLPSATPTVSTPAPTVEPSTSTTAAPTGTGSLPDLEQRLVALTNAERAKAGCGALTVDARLVASADAHAVDMVAKQYFDHTGPDGSTPTSRGAAAGYPGGVAENIATGFTEADGVMTAWMASDGHRANIVNCAYTVIGVGFDPGALPGYGGGTWVQTFGSV